MTPKAFVPSLLFVSKLFGWKLVRRVNGCVYLFTGDPRLRAIERELYNYSHVERLKRLELQSLELSRLHLDLIWCYKIVFQCVNVKKSDSFQLNSYTRTRGHQGRSQEFDLGGYKCYLSWVKETK